jgi:two-component system, chemotaxis family, protein-glutamate methylesterase/glutaminase
MSAPIRVVIADDSPTARGLIRAILEDDGGFTVIGEAATGAEAVDLVTELAPQLVIMDVHMPVLDGLEATKEIMARAPTPILIVSAVGTRDVDLSLSATQAGALMALAKPDGPSSARFDARRDELLNMAKAMANVKVVRRWSAAPSPSGVRYSGRARPADVQLVAIAASTGGPAALRRVLMDLPSDFPVPIVIVQHIAHGFAEGFVDWLRGSTPLHVKLAEPFEEARAGTVYVAPDDRHLGVTVDLRLTLSDDPAIGSFRPSADHLFERAGHALRGRLVAVIMTGMGSDGANGLATAHGAGSYVIAQDRQSSVVYGMAQEAERRGAVDEVVPLPEIALRLVTLVRGEAR